MKAFIALALLIVAVSAEHYPTPIYSGVNAPIYGGLSYGYGNLYGAGYYGYPAPALRSVSYAPYTSYASYAPYTYNYATPVYSAPAVNYAYPAAYKGTFVPSAPVYTSVQTVAPAPVPVSTASVSAVPITKSAAKVEQVKDVKYTYEEPVEQTPVIAAQGVSYGVPTPVVSSPFVYSTKSVPVGDYATKTSFSSVPVSPAVAYSTLPQVYSTWKK